ncbi:DUF418 domain-containing protein [Roseateles sp. DC23W]|uniref:DUF418 domain-containing protein n=1 Tax=Pelomonas dachongensis TaxID=3299029 RepID=A0ABW7ERK8_9BURK
MTDAARQPPRELAVDALRTLALLPVVAVNWVGYAALPDAGPLAAATPSASWLAQGALIAVAALLAAKGVTLLTFLFGYSQGLSRRARGADALAVRRRRMQSLLLLGLLHGLLIYSGDILTLYAACGLVMLGWSRLRLRQLRRRCIVLLAAATTLVVLVAPLMVLGAEGEPAATRMSLATPTDMLSWLGLNAWGFFTNVAALLLLGFLLPLGLMTAGLMAARLRLFSHPRWRPALQRYARRWLWPGLLLNAVWAVALWHGLHRAQPGWADAFYALGMQVAVPLLLGLVPAAVLAAQRGSVVMARLAATGRHTLSLYIGSSLVSLLLLSGAGLALPLGTAALTALSALYWGLWVALAPRWRGRLPLEAWLSR